MTDQPIEHPDHRSLADDVRAALEATGVDLAVVAGDAHISPPDHRRGRWSAPGCDSDDDIDAAIGRAAEAFPAWRDTPAPRPRRSWSSAGASC